MPENNGKIPSLKDTFKEGPSRGEKLFVVYGNDERRQSFMLASSPEEAKKIFIEVKGREAQKHGSASVDDWVGDIESYNFEAVVDKPWKKGMIVNVDKDGSLSVSE